MVNITLAYTETGLILTQTILRVQDNQGNLMSESNLDAILTKLICPWFPSKHHIPFV